MHLLAQATATIELPTATAVALWMIAGFGAIITVLLTLLSWFLRRELRNNDAAHRELDQSVRKLLEGDVAWVRLIVQKLGA